LEIKNGKELNKSRWNRMSRLIDADKLIEDVLNSMPIGSARGVFRAFIEEQPTAYDIDKVMKQLEELKANAFDDEVMIMNNVIEIVKAGEKDD
jgi:hypothetical protein